MDGHRVNRLELELKVGDLTLAEELSERARSMHALRIAPLIDRVCGELGEPDALDRLEVLEIDVGRVRAEHFEDDLIEQLGPALRTALAAALRRQGRQRRDRAALELLETYALTGGLPWWGDTRDGRVVARHFAVAAAQAPDELIDLLGRLAAD